MERGSSSEIKSNLKGCASTQDRLRRDCFGLVAKAIPLFPFTIELGSFLKWESEVEEAPRDIRVVAVLVSLYSPSSLPG